MEAMVNSTYARLLFRCIRIWTNVYIEGSLLEHIDHLRKEGADHICIRSPLGVYVLNI